MAERALIPVTCAAGVVVDNGRVEVLFDRAADGQIC
jgi:hypothetical protein